MDCAEQWRSQEIFSGEQKLEGVCNTSGVQGRSPGGGSGTLGAKPPKADDLIVKNRRI